VSVTHITPDGWPRGAGYAHAVSAHGRVLCTAGQIGWDPRTEKLIGPDFATQAAQALANVATVLLAGGARPQHLVRLTWYVTDRAAYLDARAHIGIAYRRHFDRHFPAMTVVVVAGLVEPGALVEIEATAVIPD
jgi:enamine deaminase RidA (YjgF/YER057c/UK114 family)